MIEALSVYLKHFPYIWSIVRIVEALSVYLRHYPYDRSIVRIAEAQAFTGVSY